MLQVYARIGDVLSAGKHVFTGVAHSPSNLLRVFNGLHGSKVRAYWTLERGKLRFGLVLAGACLC